MGNRSSNTRYEPAEKPNYLARYEDERQRYGPQVVDYPKNNYELVLTLSAKLEGMLKEKFEAEGTGLGKIVYTIIYYYVYKYL